VKTLGPEDRHHHLRINSAPDFDRLTRILTGNAIGLVLGGGGARGFAHIGVLRAFAEAGIPIDMIGGTSMGSVIAAQHAMGLDFKSMIDINRKGWLDMDPLKDKTVPVMAMLACRKLDGMIEMMFGDTIIEDLWVKFFCVSANLTQAEIMVHQKGALARSVRASMAIPGVALPVFNDGDLLVDGGVLNNLPGDIMRTICGGKVIVVDVSPQKDLTVDPSMLLAPSSSEVIWSKINPLKETIDVPNVLAIMMRTVMLSSTQTSQDIAKKVDLYVRPPIDGFGIFEWKSLDKLAEAGYEFGRKKLAEWWILQQRALAAAKAV
jgi:predicted acylesterase/phospholipase RssA